MCVAGAWTVQHAAWVGSTCKSRVGRSGSFGLWERGVGLLASGNPIGVLAPAGSVNTA